MRDILLQRTRIPDLCESQWEERSVRTHHPIRSANGGLLRTETPEIGVIGDPLSYSNRFCSYLLRGGREIRVGDDHEDNVIRRNPGAIPNPPTTIFPAPGRSQ